MEDVLKLKVGYIYKVTDPYLKKHEYCVVLKINKDKEYNGTVNFYFIPSGRIVKNIFPKTLKLEIAKYD